jgi:uptake hydrogenase large subunit
MLALSIDVGWRNGAIDAVGIRAELPQAAKVLAGRTPAEALALLGRLYSVCGQAQRAAAELALAAASGTALAPGRHLELEAAVARECVSEHLWRLLVDWPRKLGIAGAPDRFAYWYRRIAADDAGWARELAAESSRDWLGLDPERLEDWSALGGYEAWTRTAGFPFAALFAALRAAELAAAEGTVEVRGHGGTVALALETGAFVQYGEHPWLAALQAAGRGLEARVGARVVALSRLLAALVTPGANDVELELDAESPAERCGRAAVTTARGVLVHDVTLADGRIAHYGIRTPTECNFAAGGAYRSLVASRRAADPTAAVRLADLWALALDPCVPYTIRTADAGGSTGHA